MGTNVVARLTSMDQPLGVMAGNSLEIAESLDVLEGKGPQDVIDLVVEFGAEMLVLAEACPDLESGRQKINQVLKNGLALDKFARIIEAQGGDPRVIQNRALLGKAKSQIPFKSWRSGYLQGFDARLVGVASMMLGGGRQQFTDTIDHLVGIETHARIGDKIDEGQTIFVMHSNGRGESDAMNLLKQSLIIGDEPTAIPALLGPRITKREL
jgi:pyrimidine-nucleoside phosphorylase